MSGQHAEPGRHDDAALSGDVPQGTLLSLLDMSPAWANVRVADGARTEGWVANQYIVRA